MMHVVYVKIVSKGDSRYRYSSLCGVGILWL